jgi:hypothetical protein
MAYVRVPPDGAGKKVYSKTQTVGADSVETQVMHLADSNTPTQILAVDGRGAASVRFAEGQPIMGGFGSLKTTHEHPLGVYESSLDTYSSLFTVTTATGGALTYDAVGSSEVLSTTSASGSSVKLTTNRYHYYLPGSANLYKMTISCGDTGKANNVRRWGAFDTNDGAFFCLHNTNLQVVLRNSTSGSIVETAVNQANWNVDKLDGTGLSGHVLDITKINVWWLDYQWLGAGRCRFGIYLPDGTRLVCHEFKNAGANTLPFMRTGTLPISTENTNTGITGSTSELRTVCLSAYTEGNFQDYAYWRFADIDANNVSVVTNTALANIRAVATVNSKHNSVIIYPETLNVYCNEPVAITLWQATSVTGGTWTSLASIAEVNYGGTVSTTGSQKFKTLYFPAGATSIDLDKFFEKNDEGILMNADGTYEVWSVLATRLTANATTVSMNIGYKELW